MVKIDLHLHTTRYSECSKLSPEELIEFTGRLPIQGIVITEHDHIWSRDEVRELQSRIRGDFRIFGAVEVSTDIGHVLAYNLNEKRNVYNGMLLEDLAVMAREDEAALVLAHPGRFISSVPENRGDYWDQISAVEVMSNNISEPMIPQVHQAVSALGKPVVAGSDCHRTEILGLYATEFPHMPSDERELAQMIMKGQGVPWANVDKIMERREKYPEKLILLENPIIRTVE